MNTAKKRLIDFLSFLKIGQNAFEKKVGIANGYISHNKGSIGSEIISKISESYPELNMDWLLTGKGNMINGDNNKIYTSSGDNNMGLVGDNSGTYVAVADPGAKKIIDGNRVEITREVYAEERLLQEVNRLKTEIEGLKSTLNEKDKLLDEKDRTIDTLNRMIELLSDKKNDSL